MCQVDNRRKAGREKREHEESLALRQNEAIREIIPYIDIKDGTHSAQIDTIFKLFLNCIEHKTRVLLNHRNDQYFQVSLLLFTKDDRVHIRVRAHATRPANTYVDAKSSAAYYVAAARCDWKAIHDLKNDTVFPNAGLSKTGEPPYRSILLIPIISDGTCKGVVSVDASKPYEFWGAVGSDLTTQLMPYIQLLVT